MDIKEQVMRTGDVDQLKAVQLFLLQVKGLDKAPDILDRGARRLIDLSQIKAVMNSFLTDLTVLIDERLRHQIRMGVHRGGDRLFEPRQVHTIVQQDQRGDIIYRGIGVRKGLKENALLRFGDGIFVEYGKILAAVGSKRCDKAFQLLHGVVVAQIADLYVHAESVTELDRQTDAVERRQPGGIQIGLDAERAVAERGGNDVKDPLLYFVLRRDRLLRLRRQLRQPLEVGFAVGGNGHFLHLQERRGYHVMGKVLFQLVTQPVDIDFGIGGKIGA